MNIGHVVHLTFIRSELLSARSQIQLLSESTLLLPRQVEVAISNRIRTE